MDEDGKQDLESAEKIKQEKCKTQRESKAAQGRIDSCHNSGNCVDVMCWYAPHYRNYSVEIHAYNRRYSIVAAWAYTIYAVE